MKSADLKRGEAASYAKHRADSGLPGCTRAGVKKKLDSGALDAAIVNGKVNHAKADRLWAGVTGPAKNISGKSKVEQFAEAEDLPPIDQPGSPMPAGTLQDWTLRKTAAEARGKELDVELREKTLIETAPVIKFLESVNGEIGAALESLPTEVAQACAEESDPKRIAVMMRKRCDEIREAAGRSMSEFALQMEIAA